MLGIFKVSDGDRVRLLARRTAGQPDPKRSFTPLLREDRKDCALQSVKGLWVSEEAGYIDEHVREKGVQFGGMAPKEPRIVILPGDFVQNQAPVDSPMIGVDLVK